MFRAPGLFDGTHIIKAQRGSALFDEFGCNLAGSRPSKYTEDWYAPKILMTTEDLFDKCYGQQACSMAYLFLRSLFLTNVQVSITVRWHAHVVSQMLQRTECLMTCRTLAHKDGSLIWMNSDVSSAAH